MDKEGGETMLLQKMLTGVTPYFVNKNHMEHFLAHRHPEVEINYCISGTYRIRISNHDYIMKEGDFAIIGSMISHEIPAGNQSCQALTLEVGSVLLKEKFNHFSEVEFMNPIYRRENQDIDKSSFWKKISELCEEIAEVYSVGGETAELSIVGSLYKIYASVIDEILDNRNIRKRQQKDFKAVRTVEQALGVIYNCYSQNISVEEVASLTGYNKSNFCKMFKSVVGDSFHQVLNRYRIEVASNFLYETDASVEEIAVMVGFADSKAFGRVFKAIRGETPGGYRKNKQKGVNFCE